MCTVDRLQKLAGATERFERRVSKKNAPLEAFRETDSFKQLQEYFSKAFDKQVSWLKDNIDTIHTLDSAHYTEDEYRAVVGKFLVENMPRVGSIVPKTKIYVIFVSAFVAAVRDQYLRLGIIMKGENGVKFDLSNPYYQAALKNQANYLLHKSSIDDTTRGKMINTVMEARSQAMTIDETGALLSDTFDEVNSTRGFMIANTEANQAMSSGQLAFMKESGVPTKTWVVAGPGCDICDPNEDDGAIPTDGTFSSGDDAPPAHPNCECYLDAGEIDLSSIDIWEGD